MNFNLKTAPERGVFYLDQFKVCYAKEKDKNVQPQRGAQEPHEANKEGASTPIDDGVLMSLPGDASFTLQDTEEGSLITNPANCSKETRKLTK